MNYGNFKAKCDPVHAICTDQCFPTCACHGLNACNEQSRENTKQRRMHRCTLMTLIAILSDFSEVSCDYFEMKKKMKCRKCHAKTPASIVDRPTCQRLPHPLRGPLLVALGLGGLGLAPAGCRLELCPPLVLLLEHDDALEGRRRAIVGIGTALEENLLMINVRPGLQAGASCHIIAAWELRWL